MTPKELNDKMESLNNQIEMLEMSLKSEEDYLRNQLAMLTDYKVVYAFKDLFNLCDSIDLIRSSNRELDKLSAELEQLQEEAYKIAL